MMNDIQLCNEQQCTAADNCIASDTTTSTATTTLTPVSRCCLKKKCYDRVSPKVQNDLFNSFWRIADYAKQNYYLVGLMAAHSPKQTISRPVKKNKSLSWKYWVDIRGRKLSVCKGFFLAVYGVTDKRLRVLQSKLVNGEPLEDQRGKYDKHRRANQHTVNKKHNNNISMVVSTADATSSDQKASNSIVAVANDHRSSIVAVAADGNQIFLGDIFIPQGFTIVDTTATPTTTATNSDDIVIVAK